MKCNGHSVPSKQPHELGRGFLMNPPRSLRCGLRLTLFPIASAVLLWAVPPWLNKDFKDWTEKDVSALMSNSPWSKAMPLPSTDRPSQVIVDGSSSGPPATAGLGTNNAGNTSTSGSGPGSEGSNPSTARSTVLTPSTLAQSTGAPAIQPTVT